jgi:hypothetical protein
MTLQGLLKTIDRTEAHLAPLHLPSVQAKQSPPERITAEHAQAQYRTQRQTTGRPFHVAGEVDQVGRLDLVLAGLGGHHHGQPRQPEGQEQCEPGEVA